MLPRASVVLTCLALGLPVLHAAGWPAAAQTPRSGDLEAQLPALAGLPPSAVLARLAALQGVQPDNAPSTLPAPDWLARAPLPLQPGLARLALGTAQARVELDAAFAGLSPAERASLVREGRAALAAEHARALGRADAQHLALAQEVRALSARVRLPALLGAGIALARAAEDAERLLPRGVPADARLAGQCGVQGGLVFASPDCSVLVGDAGPDRYALPAVLIVDEGGRDTYANNAGGASARGVDGAPAVAMVLDLGTDDDAYASAASATGAVQGAGYLGAGLLLDEGGDDAYNVTALDPTLDGRVAAQGAGLDGVGVLWDRGAGDDAYTSRNAAQGVGLIGDGLLLDEGGNDTYAVPYTYDSEAAQGVGCYGGLGALLDLGAGRDAYDASIDDLQGMGCLGGMGLLLDQGGSDAYLVRSGWGLLDDLPVVQSGWGQGYGELGGVGVLLDEAGDDAYTAQVADASAPQAWEGHHAQGVGLLGGLGLLLDQGGDDTYRSWQVTQGAADTGEGVLRDEAGDDTYAAHLGCQGWGNAGSGALTDLGGRDAYLCAEPASGPRADGASWAAGSGGAGADSGT